MFAYCTVLFGLTLSGAAVVFCFAVWSGCDCSYFIDMYLFLGVCFALVVVYSLLVLLGVLLFCFAYCCL